MELSNAMLGMVVGLLIGSPLIWRHLSGRLLRAAGLIDPNQMTDKEIQWYFRTLFRSLGYRVAEPCVGAEQRFDFIIADGLGQRRGVLSRLWRERVTAVAVNEAIGASLESRTEAPVIISLKGFTQQARTSAVGHAGILWGTVDLAAAVKRLAQIHAVDIGWTAGKVVAHEPPHGAGAGPAHDRPGDARTRHLLDELYGTSLRETATPKCPRCGKGMIARRSGGGDYWSCAGYPRCLGTRAREGNPPLRVGAIRPALLEHVAASAISGD